MKSRVKGSRERMGCGVIESSVFISHHACVTHVIHTASSTIAVFNLPYFRLFRLFGGAQYHRAIREFTVAVRHMASPPVTEDEIANAAGTQCNALHCTVLHCTVLYCTVLHCTALHCNALHCTTLHYQ